MPSENVVKWYGGVVQVAPASEVNYISTLRQLLRQSSSPGRCGVTLADCCCGSRDVAASHSQTAVAAAGTLRRHILKLLSEFSAEQRWSQCRPSIDCESSWAIASRAPVVSKIPS